MYERTLSLLGLFIGAMANERLSPVRSSRGHENGSRSQNVPLPPMKWYLALLA